MTQLSITVIQPHEIVKEGWLQKKSETMRFWRKRWFVLTSSHLYRFTEEKQYTDPSGVIRLSKIEEIATNEEKNIMCLRTDQYFDTYLKFSTLQEMQQWLNILTGYINIIQVPIVVECEEHKQYSCDFQIRVPYHEHHKYEINNIIDDIIDYVQRKHGVKFCATKIDRKSFVAMDIDIHHSFDANILDYDKQDIITKGLRVCIKIASNRCEHMLNDALCPIYVTMRDKEVYSEDNFQHLLEYSHFENELIQKPECKEGEDCESYKRLLDGGNELKDRCHVKIYRHHYIAPLHTAQSSQEDIERDIRRSTETLCKISDKLQAIDIEKWANDRDTVVLQIITLSDMLEKTIGDVGIAKTLSGGTSIIGGGLCIAGVVLLPVSAGTSLGLTIAGGAAMLTSGVTTLSSSVIKFLTENDIVKRCIAAYESIQPDARRVAFLLDDYAVTFNVTRGNISVWESARFGGSTLVSLGGKIKAVDGLVKLSNGMKAYNAIARVADTTEDVVQIGKAAQVAKAAQIANSAKMADIAETAVYGSGGFAGKVMGWIAGPLGIVMGIWDIVDGIKTMNDAEKAILKLNLLAIDIRDQTEKIKDAYNKIVKLH